MTGLDGSKGVQLSWGIEGPSSAPPLLLLPPLGRSRSAWQSQSSALTDSYLVVMPDTRGAGQSYYTGDDYSLGLFAADALTVLDHLNIQAIHVAGWSMGAAVAQELALLSPDRVRSLTLLTPWARTDEVMAAHFRQMLAAIDADASLIGVEAMTLELILSEEALAGIGPLSAAARAAVEEPGFPSAQALAGHIRACLNHNTEERLRHMSIPSLIVGGAQDRLIPPSHAESTAGAIVGAQLVVLEGPLSSHALPIEMAPEVNHIVRSFLERH